MRWLRSFTDWVQALDCGYVNVAGVRVWSLNTPSGSLEFVFTPPGEFTMAEVATDALEQAPSFTEEGDTDEPLFGDIDDLGDEERAWLLEPEGDA